MSRFLDDASQIFEAALAAPVDSSEALTILIHSTGQIRIVDGAECSIENLQRLHGSETAYRVTRGSERVSVEGQDGFSRCVLEAAQPRAAAVSAARALGVFRDQRLYCVTGTLAIT